MKVWKQLALGVVILAASAVVSARFFPGADQVLLNIGMPQAAVSALAPVREGQALAATPPNAGEGKAGQGQAAQGGQPRKGPAAVLVTTAPVASSAD